MNYSSLYDRLMTSYGKSSSLLPFGLALPPVRCTIEVTYACNLRCAMCYQREERKRRGRREELTKEEIKEIIDQMPPKALITLTGGELLLKDYALELIDYATEHRYCNIITNGALINEKVAKKLVEDKVPVVGVSLDGLSEFHNKIRGVPGSFEKSIAGIKLLQEEKVKQKKRFPLIDIKTLIFPGNIDQLYPLYQLAQELKVNYLTLSSLKESTIQFSPPILDSIPEAVYAQFGRVEEDFDLDLLETQIGKIIKERGSAGVRFYPNGLDRCLREYYGNQITLKDYLPCFFPWSAFNVSPYGDVFPCISLNVGNIKEKSLNQIWNGEKMRQFRLKLKKVKIFPACHSCCYARLRNK